MIFRQLFDAQSSTFTYLLADESTREAALIDPVIENVERDLALVRDLELTLAYVLDTHVHADHVTGAGAIRERTSARTVSSRSGAPCADVHVGHGDVLHLGAMLATPGPHRRLGELPRREPCVHRRRALGARMRAYRLSERRSARALCVADESALRAS